MKCLLKGMVRGWMQGLGRFGERLLDSLGEKWGERKDGWKYALWMNLDW